MSWNYRVLKTKRCWNIGGTDYSEDHYQVHEVYYKFDGDIDTWSVSPCAPFGESAAELNDDLNMFIRATVLPVLEEKDNTLVEVKD